MPDQEVDIRQATLADFDALLPFHRALYVDHRNAVVPEHELELIEYVDYDRVLEEDLRSLLSNPDAYVLCARRGDEIIGYISGRVKTEPRRVLARRGFVEDWYVVPQARGNGLGARLLAELEAIFVERACQLVESFTWMSNAEAIKAHQRLGFHPLMVTLRKPLKGT